jgi:hypothetical protein
MTNPRPSFQVTLKCACVCRAIACITKRLNLRLKTRPTQLLGSLPLAFSLPTKAYPRGMGAPKGRSPLLSYRPLDIGLSWKGFLQYLLCANFSWQDETWAEFSTLDRRCCVYGMHLPCSTYRCSPTKSWKLSRNNFMSSPLDLIGL